jgi:hypothetical protein
MECRNLVVVSDLHCGCRLGLVPYGAKRIRLDDGGWYEPSAFQRKLAGMWNMFWTEFVPSVTSDEPFAVCINGDTIDGIHHESVTQLSHNLLDQRRIAYDCLAPIRDKAVEFYMLRGTEVHVGKSAQHEEALAESLGAKKNKEGQHARYDLWIKVGGDYLAHIMHHIGTSGSQSYETTAIHKELVEEYIEAGRWHEESPQIVIRSHRHRMAGTLVPIEEGLAYSLTCPGWQGKTPFTWRIQGARNSEPQFGGIVIRRNDEVGYFRAWVKSPRRSKAE